MVCGSNPDRAAPRGIGPGPVRRPVEIDPLADGRHDRIALHDKFGALDRHRTASSAGIRRAKLGADALEPGHTAVFSDNPRRSGQVMNLYAFGQSVRDLFRVSRHLFSAAPIDDTHRFTPQALGDPGRIDRHVAAADDHDPVAGTSAGSPS